MTASPLLPLIEQLIDVFDDDSKQSDDDQCVHHFKQSTSTVHRLLHTLEHMNVDELGSVELVEDVRAQYEQTDSTISNLLELEWEENHDFSDSILRIFMHYYNMIMDMPDASLPQKQPHLSSSSSSPSSDRQLQLQENIANEQLDKNDIRWLIYCDVVERLLYRSVYHCADAQHLIWTQIVQRIIFAHREQHMKRSVIMLCRFIICFAPSSSEQLAHQSLFVDIVHCLRAFLIEFVPTNHKRYQTYNDWNTLCDMESVFQIISRSILKRAHLHLNCNEDRAQSVRSSAYFERLSTQICAYYDGTRMSDIERRQKKRLVAHIGKTWKQVLFRTIPSLRSKCDYRSFDYQKYLYLFGSSATHLDQAGSDMDLYVVTPKHAYLSKPGEWQLFEQLSQSLQQCAAYPLCVTNIFECAVPIIKIEDETHAIDVDVSFGKQSENIAIVELLNMICDDKNSADEKVRKFIIAIKHWAKRRDLNDARRNRVSSFGFVLCAISYLQTQRVVPRLVRKQAQKPKWERRSTRFLQCNEIELDTAYSADYGHDNLGHLLCGFFDYYAHFNYKQHSVSLFQSKLNKHKRRYFDLSGRRLKDNKLTFVIEDPIQTNYNCAKNVRPWSLNLIRIECLRAKLVLKYGHGGFGDLCKRV